MLQQRGTSVVQLHQESFLEKLTGVYIDGTPVGTVPSEQRLLKSITDHLSRLLNTRQGSLQHLPDYGVPDIAQIYRGLPASFNQLRFTVLELIQKYEPRLERMKMTLLPFKPEELKIAFQLSGYFKGGHAVVFQTSFSSSGEAAVLPMKKQ